MGNDLNGPKGGRLRRSQTAQRFATKTIVDQPQYERQPSVREPDPVNHDYSLQDLVQLQQQNGHNFGLAQCEEAISHLNSTADGADQGITLDLSANQTFESSHPGPEPYKRQLEKFSTLTTGQETIVFLALNFQSNCCLSRTLFDDFCTSAPDSL
jgi:hypothetical protein